jgi:hypothetical protein
MLHSLKIMMEKIGLFIKLMETLSKNLVKSILFNCQQMEDKLQELGFY